MSEATPGDHPSPAGTGPAGPDALIEELDQAECLRLVSGQEVGRIAYNGRFGPTVVPVNYLLYEESIVFRTGQDSPMDEDLRTGIADAEYKIAFEIDELHPVTRDGWSVLVQGSAHHVTSEEERAAVAQADVSPWPGGPKELFMRIRPTRITGRRISHPG
ncbi:MAG TPA: pyridoxamine 5'-phosphate oxidase family protein [Streptosporangiaceae bacterium]|nr:pyridoxamine 5'-phosphate oxidase family protein [Streptosporangiaceae bacterium]